MCLYNTATIISFPPRKICSFALFTKLLKFRIIYSWDWRVTIIYRAKFIGCLSSVRVILYSP